MIPKPIKPIFDTRFSLIVMVLPGQRVAALNHRNPSVVLPAGRYSQPSHPA
jgi:hypothetical protein